MGKKAPVYLTKSFETLMNKKKRFLTLLTLFFLSYYLSLPILTSYFPQVMTYPIYQNITFAWVFAFTQFLLTAIICFIYYWKSKSYDQLVQHSIREESEKRGHGS